MLGLLAENKQALTRMGVNNDSPIIQSHDRLLKATQCFNQLNIHRQKEVFISSRVETIKNSDKEGEAIKGSIPPSLAGLLRKIILIERSLHN